MAGRRREEADAVLDGPALGIGGSVVKPPDAGEGHGRGAHGTGLERDVEVAIDQPFAADGRCGSPDRQHLGMGGGILVGQGAVSGAGDDGGAGDDHAAHRDLAPRRRAPRLFEGDIHERWRHAWPAWINSATD